MKRHIAVCLTASLLLSACVTDQNKENVGMVVGGVVGAVAGSQFGSGAGRFVGAAVGALAGTFLGRELAKLLNPEETKQVDEQSSSALANTQDGQTVTWTNPDGKTKATLTPRDTGTETRKVAMLRQKNVEPPPPMEMIGATWEATRSANLRAGPSTNSEVVGGLRAGETFQAIGKVKTADWIVVGKNNRAIGYVASSLVRASSASALPKQAALRTQAVDLDTLKAQEGGIDLDKEGLVADIVPVEQTCRTMDVQVNKSEKQVKDSIRACRGADGTWELI